jgi:hypothetical protein
MIEMDLVTKFNYIELIHDIANGKLVLLPSYNSAGNFLLEVNNVLC